MACGTPVAALDRGAVREIVDDGDDRDRVRRRSTRWSAACRACSRSTGGACARAPSSASASIAWSREYADVYRRIVDAHRAADETLNDRPCSPSSPTPTMSRWRAAARWRGCPRRACGWCFSARHMESAAGEFGPVRNDALGGSRAREVFDAAEALGIADLLLLDHPDGDLRWSRVAEFHADILAAIARYRPAAVITFGDDGLYWHLDHVGVYERTTTAVRSLGADGPPLYYVTMPRGMMRAIVEPRAGARVDAARQGSLEPGAGCVRPRGRAADRHRRRAATGSAAKLAAIRHHRSQMGAGPLDLITDDEARQWLGTEQFHCDEGAVPLFDLIAGRTRCTNAHDAMLRATLDILRCPYCGGRLELVDSLHHRADGDQIRGRHPRLSLLHLPRRRRHSRPAPAAGAVDGARARRSRAGRTSPCGSWSVSSDPAQAAIFERAAASNRSTYREIVDALGPGFEGGYFLYRFSDPTFIVARRRRPSSWRGAVLGGADAGPRRLRRVRPPDALAARPLVAGARAGRPLLPEDLARAAVHGARLRGRVLRRQRAAAVRPRRVRLRDVLRRVSVHLDQAAVHRRDDARSSTAPGRARSSSTTRTTSSTWSPSHGQPLSPAGYRDLFETIEPRIFGEAGLFDDVVGGRSARPVAS